MKDYQSEEWVRMIVHAKKSLDSSCPLIEDEVLVAVNDELEMLREDNKSLRDYIASLMGTMPKIKADAVREAAQLVMYEYEGEARNRDIAEYLEDYADKLERGE